jgi:hypothetical protein
MRFSKTIRGHSRRAIVFYHFWGVERWAASLLRWFFAPLEKDFTCIYYKYSDDILSSDVNGTREGILRIVDDSLKTLRDFEEVSLFGASLGSFISILVARERKVKRVVLATGALSFPRVIWFGRSKRINHIKKGMLQKGWTLKALEKEWKPISPEFHLCKGKQVLFMLSNSDSTLGVNNTMQLARELRKNNSVVVVESNLDHVPAIGQFLLSRGRIIDFLRKK